MFRFIACINRNIYFAARKSSPVNIYFNGYFNGQ
jgi:hypothetical protein